MTNAAKRHPNYGRLQVDFAGTRDEAIEFARSNNLSVGNKNHLGNEGLPTLSAIYTSRAGKRALFDRLAALGWDDGSVLDTSYTEVTR